MLFSLLCIVDSLEVGGGATWMYSVLLMNKGFFGRDVHLKSQLELMVE